MKTIYALIDPRNGLVFYVGRTSDIKSRINKHNSKHTNKGTPKHDYVQGILEAGLKCEYIILDEVTKEEGKFWESFYTDTFRAWGFTLYNNLYKGMGNQTSFDGEARKRAVVALNKSGEFVRDYPSSKEASADVGVKAIVQSLTRRKKQIGGYIWFYKEEYIKMSKAEIEAIVEWANTSGLKANSGSFKKGQKSLHKVEIPNDVAGQIISLYDNSDLTQLQVCEKYSISRGIFRRLLLTERQIDLNTRI